MPNDVMKDALHFPSYSVERLFKAGLALVANTSHGDLMSADGAFALYRSCSSGTGRVEWSGIVKEEPPSGYSSRRGGKKNVQSLTSHQQSVPLARAF